LNTLKEDLNFFDSSLYRPAIARKPIVYYILLDYRGTIELVIRLEGYDIVLGNDFLYKYDPYVADGRIFSREEKGTLNLLLKREVYRSLKDKNTEYIVFYTIISENYKLTTNNPRLTKLLRKFADVFPDNLPKELPPELRRFLGLATYYRYFVKDFAKIAVALYNLTKEADEELYK
ncbi:hypothetical protein N7537_007085, partial [Penicillium hordei]